MRFNRETTPSPLCVCISALSDSLLLYPYVHFVLWKKKKQEKKQIIFLYISIVILP